MDNPKIVINNRSCSELSSKLSQCELSDFDNSRASDILRPECSTKHKKVLRNRDKCTAKRSTTFLDELNLHKEVMNPQLQTKIDYFITPYNSRLKVGRYMNFKGDEDLCNNSNSELSHNDSWKSIMNVVLKEKGFVKTIGNYQSKNKRMLKSGFRAKKRCAAPINSGKLRTSQMSISGRDTHKLIKKNNIISHKNTEGKNSFHSKYTNDSLFQKHLTKPVLKSPTESIRCYSRQSSSLKNEFQIEVNSSSDCDNSQGDLEEANICEDITKESSTLRSSLVPKVKRRSTRKRVSKFAPNMFKRDSVEPKISKHKVDIEKSSYLKVFKPKEIMFTKCLPSRPFRPNNTELKEPPKIKTRPFSQNSQFMNRSMEYKRGHPTKLECKVDQFMEVHKRRHLGTKLSSQTVVPTTLENSNLSMFNPLNDSLCLLPPKKPIKKKMVKLSPYRIEIKSGKKMLNHMSKPNQINGIPKRKTNSGRNLVSLLHQSI